MALPTGKVLFSIPHADASNVVLLRAGESNIKTAEDMSGKTVGVQLGSPAAGIIKSFEARLTAAGKPGYADVKQYEHYPEAYQSSPNKRIDAMVNSRSTMMVVIRDAPGKFSRSSPASCRVMPDRARAPRQASSTAYVVIGSPDRLPGNSHSFGRAAFK